MPELPEVETIRRQLIRKIKGKTIVKTVNFRDLKARIKDIKRRAKILILELDNGQDILIHLKLTGRLIYNGPIEKSTRMILYFNDKSYLVFNDWRKFGYFKLIKHQNLARESFIKNLGPELFDINLEQFKELLKTRKRAKIKPLLLNQQFLSGIGNIYAQEACFCAKIRPQRKVSSLTQKEIKTLFKCLTKILKAAIKHGGSSVDAAYLDVQGKPGQYDKLLKIYNRQNKKCLICHSKIKNINLGGRGTRYCPQCQK